MRISLRSVSITSIALALFFAPLLTSAQETKSNECPNGEVRITDDTRAQARAAGIPDSSQCWNPSSAQAGQSVAQAKTYLRSILCGPDNDNYGGKGPDGTIEGLDGQFSVCAAKFLQAARGAGIDACVREGARSVEKQNEYVRRGVIACKKGAQCEHPRGIAIDVNVRPNVGSCASYKKLHANAPKFGLTFYLGCKDAYHFVPAKGGSCSGGGVIQPDQDYDFPQYYSPTLPSAGLTDQFRQSLGMPAQPTGQSQPTIPSYAPAAQNQIAADNQANLEQPSQSQFCLPEYKCSGSTLVYQNSFCATEVKQVCPLGCGNGACISASSAVKSASSTGGTQTNTNTITNEDDEPSVLDKLGTIAGFGATSTSIGTATPLQLILGLAEDQSSGVQPTTTRDSHLASTGSVATLPVINAPQTFTSDNLNQNVPTAQVQSDRSTLVATLETMKSVLLRALDYLRPFQISRERGIGIDGHAVGL